MVVWLIGLSGSGKTTLANEIVEVANKKSKNTVLLDGDIVREIFDNDIGYSMEDRLLNAKRICRIGKLINDQGINVVCAILSIFQETRDWNRENIKDYYEVFIDTPIDVLIDRDSKRIYSRYDKGEISEVVGMDIKFQTPSESNLVIKNNKSEEKLLSYAKKIVSRRS